MGQLQNTSMRGLFTLVLSFSLVLAKKSPDGEKRDWAKKDIRDYSDADLERLLDQWDEDEEPTPPDELPDGHPEGQDCDDVCQGDRLCGQSRNRGGDKPVADGLVQQPRAGRAVCDRGRQGDVHVPRWSSGLGGKRILVGAG